MLNFIEHSIFNKEFSKFASKYHSYKDLEHLKNLFKVQFDPVSPRLILGPGKIHRVKDCTVCVLWKVEMAVKGLKKNQCPRVWFGVAGDTLAFLCIRTHIDNYSDDEVNKIAESLITDIF